MPFSLTSRFKFLFGSTAPARERDESPEAFLQSLKHLEQAAIQQLSRKVGGFLLSNNYNGHLSPEDLEEVVNDAVFITLKKIRDDQFNIKEASPATFAIAVAKNLIGNRLQKRKIQTTSLEEVFGLPSADFDPECYLHQKERDMLLGALLDKIEEPCRRLILLRYYERLTDEEVIQQKLTEYSNAKSLKVQRCKCLKKLAVILHGHKRFFIER